MYPVNKKDVIALSLCVLAGVFIGAHIVRTNNQPATLVTKRPTTWKGIFEEPLNPYRTDCLNLFDKPKLDKDFYSPNYLQHRRQLDALLKRITDPTNVHTNARREVIEGNSGKYWYW